MKSCIFNGLDNDRKIKMLKKALYYKMRQTHFIEKDDSIFDMIISKLDELDILYEQYIIREMKSVKDVTNISSFKTYSTNEKHGQIDKTEICHNVIGINNIEDIKTDLVQNIYDKQGITFIKDNMHLPEVKIELSKGWNIIIRIITTDCKMFDNNEKRLPPTKKQYGVQILYKYV